MAPTMDFLVLLILPDFLLDINSLEYEEEPAGEQDEPQGQGEDPALPGHDDPAPAAEAVLPREHFPPSPRPPPLLSAAPGRGGRRRRFDLLILAAVHAGVRLCPGSDLRGICPAPPTPASQRRRHPAKQPFDRGGPHVNKPFRKLDYLSVPPHAWFREDSAAVSIQRSGKPKNHRC